jgi:phospholipid-binding lipoprotein MlaA
MKRITFFIALMVLLSGCASPLKTMQYEDQQLKDPYQSVNREIYAVNDALDKHVVRPIAEIYSKIAPPYFVKRINSFFSNLSEPAYFINNLLQLDLEGSVVSLGRFAINSSIGIGGLFDVMTPAGTPKEAEDFGQTLAYWGVKPGSYVVLPFFGPSNVRDAIGRVGDTLLYSPTRDVDDSLDLVTYYTLSVTDTRTRLLSLDKILDSQVDPYSFMRSAYEQARINAIYDGNPPEQEEDF